MNEDDCDIVESTGLDCCWPLVGDTTIFKDGPQNNPVVTAGVGSAKKKEERKKKKRKKKNSCQLSVNFLFFFLNFKITKNTYWIICHHLNQS